MSKSPLKPWEISTSSTLSNNSRTCLNHPTFHQSNTAAPCSAPSTLSSTSNGTGIAGNQVNSSTFSSSGRLLSSADVANRVNGAGILFNEHYIHRNLKRWENLFFLYNNFVVELFNKIQFLLSIMSRF